jgi:hypothetical protein
LGNLLYLSVSGKFAFIAIFMLIGFLATFFSKNMVVILVIAMAATSIIQFGARGAIEGMEGEEDEDEVEGMEGEAAKEEEPAKEAAPKKEEEKEVIDKVISDQKDLVDKVKQLEPMMKEIESFVDRINKFSEYTSSK